MKHDDTTVQILIEIRDEIRSNSQRIDQTNLRIDLLRNDLGARIDALGGKLDGMGQPHSGPQLRTATAIAELSRIVDQVAGLLKERLDGTAAARH